MLHSGRSGTLLHLLPSNASCILALLGRGVGVLTRCNSYFLALCVVLLFCSVGVQFTDKSHHLIFLPPTTLWIEAWLFLVWLSSIFFVVVVVLVVWFVAPSSKHHATTRATQGCLYLRLDLFSPLWPVGLNWNWSAFSCPEWFQICMLAQQCPSLGPSSAGLFFWLPFFIFNPLS